MCYNIYFGTYISAKARKTIDDLYSVDTTHINRRFCDISKHVSNYKK